MKYYHIFLGFIQKVKSIRVANQSMKFYENKNNELLLSHGVFHNAWLQ